MYLKPGTNPKQREFVKLSAESFDTQVVQAWRNSQRRKVALADFTRINEASVRIREHLAATDQPPLAPNSLALRYFATQHAREPDGTQPAVPEHATYRQLCSVDEACREMAQEQQAEQSSAMDLVAYIVRKSLSSSKHSFRCGTGAKLKMLD
ncbi:hypothetical protein GQ600_2406 [Phytophthora cactorum]|nr:hypothetical protein GQ600_2406 [Phytophthora cactorum]